MASLYVNEYSTTSTINVQAVMVPPGQALARQQVAIGGSSTASAAFNANTGLIMVATDAICSITIGPATPTAVATAERMAANETRFYAVPQGAGWKIAVITNS